MLKVAISGAGYVVPFHINAWRKSGVDITAIFDPDLDRACARADAFGIGAAFDCLNEMIEKSGADILDVASPREYHVTQALMGLDAGLAVLCQKPVAVNKEEADLLSDRLAEGGRLMVHENWRFRPEYRVIANWIDKGLLGDVYHAQFSMRTSALLPNEEGIRPALLRQPFFANQDRLLVGEVLIHHIDTLRRLFGEMTLEWSTLSRTQSDLPGETYGSMVFRASNGASIALTGDMTAIGAPPAATDHLEVSGNRGRFVFDGKVATLFSEGAISEVMDFCGIDTLQQSFDSAVSHFVEALAFGKPFETSLSDNLQTLSIVDAVYRKGVKSTKV